MVLRLRKRLPTVAQAQQFEFMGEPLAYPNQPLQNQFGPLS